MVDCSNIFAAIYLGDRVAFEALLRAGCANVKDSFDDAVLLDCLNKGRLDFFKMLLDFGADVMAADYLGNNSLHKSSLRGELDFVLMILKYQNHLDIAGSDGFTALNYAASFQHWDVVEVLLAAGACPDIPDEYGITASKRIAMTYAPSDSVNRPSIEALLGF